jgi:hypothetical protein
MALAARSRVGTGLTQIKLSANGAAFYVPFAQVLPFFGTVTTVNA